jgi:23S rRNA pseudouridine955/2504/2580 synthase/23S rRNA pseudouridine1911/1915/1917 synthase
MNLGKRIIKSKIPVSAEGARLDDYLSSRFTYHQADKWREIIADGQILLNEKTCEPENILHAEDIIKYIPENLEEPPVDLNYSIVYEDEYVFVINKSGNLPCHPAGPFFKHTLWHHISNLHGKIYLVNRLDRETSGLLIAARSPEIAGKSAKQQDLMKKEYRALVFGKFPESVNAEGYLTKDSESIVRKKRRFIFENQLPAEAEKAEAVNTFLGPLWSNDRFSLVKAILKTGRLHQIRATLFSLGFPLVGDKLYGPDDRIYLKIREDKISQDDWNKLVMHRQALHSYRLNFIHPVTRKEMEFTAEIPNDMQSLML